MNTKPTISIVLPVYNEGEHLERSFDCIHETVEPLDAQFEYVLVDDGSNDETWPTCLRMARRNPRISAIRFSRNFGKEAAIFAGLETASGDAVVVMDADLQHPPELIGRMFELWRSGEWEVIDGVKKPTARPTWIHEIGATLFYYCFRNVTGCDLRGSSDFKLLDRVVVEAYLGLSERRPFFRGLTSWMGFRHASVPFEVAARTSGDSKWSYSRLTRFAVDALLSYSGIFVHGVTLLGCLFLVFAMGMALYTLAQKWLGLAAEGFSTVILVQLGVGSCIMLSLGVLGEYVVRIHDELKQRPRYIISRQLLSQTAESQTALRRIA